MGGKKKKRHCCKTWSNDAIGRIKTLNPKSNIRLPKFSSRPNAQRLIGYRYFVNGANKGSGALGINFGVS